MMIGTIEPRSLKPTFPPPALLLLLAALAAPDAMNACTVTVVAIPQVVVRKADVVAEVVSIDGQTEFATRRVWKGAPPPRITVALQPYSVGSCEPYVEILAGTVYLFISEAGESRIVAPGSARLLLRYLEHPVRVSRRDLMAMLRGWMGGSVSDASMARWVADIKSVADVDDWQLFEGEEHSLTLGILSELSDRLNDQGALEELTCELAALRTRYAPRLVDALTQPELTERDAGELDAVSMSLDDACR